MADTARLLIIEARFYEDIADELVRGALAAVAAAGATYDRIAVPGVFEIPAALAMAVAAHDRYDGYVVLGCVIRGETTHYEIVANESARGIIELSVRHQLALGNGILTVENDDQAWARARASDQDKGGGAARAALAMVAMRRRFGLGR